MFFLYNMERRVTLHPSYFGRNMHELVTSKLLKDVEGTCAGSYYIISIMDTFDISEGRILPGTGLAEFTVGYRAVVWRPFKGETVDAVVYSINPQGFFAQAGPLRLFVSAHLIPGDIKWDPNATPLNSLITKTLSSSQGLTSASRSSVQEPRSERCGLSVVSRRITLGVFRVELILVPERVFTLDLLTILEFNHSKPSPRDASNLDIDRLLYSLGRSWYSKVDGY
ncbi:hypothetical protein V2G26_000770 [Clonostachys chloroleuca]